MARKIKPLDSKSLRKRCNPKQFDFDTTDEITIEKEIIGQDRAIEAIEYGLDVHRKGFNIFVMGNPGFGKHTLTQKLVILKSRQRSVATDWCYVYNFDDPLQPKVLQLSPGLGRQLQTDMDDLIEKLHHEFTETTAFHAIELLKRKYNENPKVIDHLNDALINLQKHISDFVNKPEANITLFDQPHIELPPFSRLKVNVLVDNSRTIGSPVIYEDNPIYHNLIGRVENMHIEGSLVSDFTLIRPGSLHRANNGYLILDAAEVLAHHLAWDGVKRVIHKQEIRIEPLEQSIEFWSSQTLVPEPIPVDIKIILIGDRDTYHMMCDEEPDFKELFKVVADFENDLPRNEKNNLEYAQLISTIAKQEKLKPLHRTAVAHVIEHSSRLVEDTEKLSAHMHSIKSIVQQADYWASSRQRKIIDIQDIKKAIEKQEHRINRVEERIFEEIKRGTISIDTHGEKIGQLNALTIVTEGEYEFGQPSRITATAHVGEGSIVDIQREIDLSGAIHSKGILTLTGFIKSRYACAEKLSLSATITFEQLYTPIDGDSASAAELCALISALAKLPIKQSLALTGSVTQFGELQPISSINEKIEGFHKVCAQKKLTGDQGVIIPSANVKNLMLNEDVIHSARKGLFHIYPVDHIDDALLLLFGRSIGKRNSKGKYPKSSINYHVEDSLQNFSVCKT